MKSAAAMAPFVKGRQQRSHGVILSPSPPPSNNSNLIIVSAHAADLLPPTATLNRRFFSRGGKVMTIRLRVSCLRATSVTPIIAKKETKRSDPSTVESWLSWPAGQPHRS